jgi:hypothetical protein
MVRGLLTPNLVGTDPVAGTSDGPAPETDVADVDLPEFTRLVASFGVTDPAEQPWQQAAKLTVTSAELDLIEELSPLIGATPRAVKRYINIYLLLSSMGRSRNWPMPEQGQLALLLALATGLPDLAAEVLPTLTRATAQPHTLRTVLPADTAAGAQLARLHTWLADHPTWHDLTLAGTDRWIDLILRFRFDRLPAW